MRISNHFLNISLFIVFTLLIVAPFAVMGVKKNSAVLGDQSVRTFLKKSATFSNQMLIKNLETTVNSEKDMILILDSINSSKTIYPLYEISNPTEEKEHFVIVPSAEALGKLENKRVSLIFNNAIEETIYYDGTSALTDDNLEIMVLPHSKATITLFVTSYTEEEATPISFDLTLEKR